MQCIAPLALQPVTVYVLVGADIGLALSWGLVVIPSDSVTAS